MKKTYIFDLYGTLVDIKTDESKKDLWKHMAGIYAAYGADYTPDGIHKAYDRICAEEAESITKILNVWHPEMELKHPEVELTRVFARILLEAENTHQTAATIDGKDIKLLSVDEVAQSEWAHFVSNTFRVISREKLKLYPGTIETLKKLRKKGCKLYLLSNAQGSFTRSELEMMGLPEHLDGIYISSEKQIKKPQPEFMEWLLKEYEIDKSEAVMVGNEMNCDMGIAMACGMKGIFLNTFGWDDARIKKEMDALGKNAKASIKIIRDGDISKII